jgi:MFS family permease
MIMENTLKSKELNFDKARDKYSKMLVWACFFVFVLMMGSKNAYTAELVTIQDVFKVDKAVASLAMTYYFVTYAAGQVLLSFVMGKINLRLYLIAVAGVSSILTVFIAFMPSMTAMYVLCTVNGALQAGIYAACMAVISKNLNKEYLPYANKIMSLGTAIASMISYGVPALFVALGSWNMPFITLGILFGVSVVFYFYASKKIKAYPVEIVISNDVNDEKAEHPVYVLNSKMKKVGLLLMKL